jgi:phage tail sheath protein FI
MAEILISPGVSAIENDQSQVTQGPVTVGAAIIGPTVKGPVEIPTVVTSYSDYQNKFGTYLVSASNVYTYFTSIAAYNYFQNGGESLLVSRVVSGTFTAASSSNILNNITSTPGAFATASKDLSALSNPISIEFRIVDNSSNTYRFLPTASGAYQDDVDGKLYFFASGALNTTISNLAAKITSVTGLGVTSNASTSTISFTGSVSSSAYNGYVFQTGSGASFSTQATLGGGVDGIGSNAFKLETLSKGIIMNSTGPEDSAGALASGSADNIRWQIVSANTSSGTFSLVIRRGNDNTISQAPLETWTNLSLDPLAPNYISKVIGDQVRAYDSSTNQVLLTGDNPNRSRYVRVSSVISPTPSYFNNNGTAKAQYTASIPVPASGTFGSAQGTIAADAKFYNQIITGATNTQGVVGTDYTNMINLLANTDDYKFNVLLTPGLTSQENATQVTSIISNTENRGDNIYVLDLTPYDVDSTSTVVAAAASRDTSYAASYWPWVMTVDPDTNANVWVPASTMIGGVYAKTDAISEPWFAPAGINRGGLNQVVRAKLKLSQTDRDNLYQGKINPIATFPGRGVVVYGQKTLQTQASALDRVNVRRLLIALKSYISQVASSLLFEQNTAATRNIFLSQVNPYLADVQARQGLYAFQVVMDESNNTAATIDQNQLNGAIYLQPTKTAEFIYLTFNITPTGATFPG